MSSKQKTVKTATATVSAPAVESVAVKVESVVSVAPVVEKKAAKKATAKKTVEVETVEVLSAPVVVLEEVVSVVLAPVVVEETSLSAQSTEFFSKLQQLGAVISGLKSEYRALEKRFTKELKVSAKNSNKKRKRAANRAPSGFVKPTKISDELATFLDKPTGSEMARTEVTRDINLYIRTNSLQDKANGRKINPDPKLADLLKINAGEELTYFNLQKYMSRHFAKTAKPLVSTATDTA
jgi:chromatin remodeling complex protein RSC6